MFSLQNDNKKEFYLLEFLFWSLLLGLLPISFETISLLQFLKLVVYFTAAWFVGEMALSKLEPINLLPFFFKTGVNILLGSIILSFISFIANANIFIYIIFSFTLFYIVKFYKIDFKFNTKNLFAFIPFGFLYIHNQATIYATTSDFNIFLRDYYYYNAITESLFQNFNIYNSFYCKGQPINYPTIPFQPIAQIAQFSNIKSSVLTWGIFGKLISTVSFITVAHFIILFVHFLKNKTISAFEFNYKKFFLASLFLVFLAPIHFLNLVKLKLTCVTLPGFGFVLPLGSLGFSVAIFFIGLAFMSCLLNNKNKDYFYATVFIGLIAGSKIAALLPVGIFLGIIALFQLFKKDFSLTITLIATLPIIFLFNKLSGNSTFLKIVFSTKSAWVDYALQQASKNGIAGSVMKQVIIVLALNIFFWIGYKVFSVLLFQKNSLNKNKKLTLQITIACLVSIIVSFIPGFVLNLFFEDEFGKKLWDINYDLMQFVRASIVLLTIFSVAALIFVIHENKSKKIAFATLICCLVWCALNSYFVINQSIEKPKLASNAWYNEVKKEFEQTKPKLMAINGNENYSGVCLSSYGIGPWYCTGNTVTGDGYSLNYEAYKRSANFATLFHYDGESNKPYFRKIISNLKDNNVDCIVLTPNDTSSIHFKTLVDFDEIEPYKNCKWLYKIK